MNFSKYDLILLDIMMPGLDGFELCQQLRSRVECPIIFLTAKIQEADIVRVLGPVSYTHLDVYKRQSPNRMMINSVITNHVICVKVTGKGRLKSLIAYKTFSTFQIPV